MAQLNMCAAKDPFARYKFTQPILNHVKQRTIIINANQIAKDLNISSKTLTRFIGIELGTISKCDSSTIQLNGAHSTMTIVTIIRKYINLFMMCPKCHIPELVPTKDGQLSCNACSYVGPMPDHKLKK